MNKEYIQLQIEGSDWSYGSRWGDQMEAAILEFSKYLDKNSRILDIGCGEGRGLDALKNSGFTDICGVDIAPEKIAKARSKGHSILEYDFHKLDDLAFKKSFDYTFCSHTLEHAYDIKKAFRSIEYVTKNKLFFIVPIGETKEQVEKVNPSHTCPFNTIDEIETILTEMNYTFLLSEKIRMCKEVWGYVYYEKQD